MNYQIGDQVIIYQGGKLTVPDEWLNQPTTIKKVDDSDSDRVWFLCECNSEPILNEWFETCELKPMNSVKIRQRLGIL